MITPGDAVNDEMTGAPGHDAVGVRVRARVAVGVRVSARVAVGVRVGVDVRMAFDREGAD